MAATDLVGQIIEDLDPGCMVLKFILVAEVISADGARAVWIEAHEDASRGDKYGLLVEALETEKARHHAATAEWDSRDNDAE